MSRRNSTNIKSPKTIYTSDIDDESLTNLSVKELNRLLKSLTQDERLNIKRRRRLLKNRGYAANCRTKRLSQKEILELEKDQLEEDIAKLSHENELINVRLNAFKQRFEDLQAYTKIVKTKLNEKK